MFGYGFFLKFQDIKGFVIFGFLSIMLMGLVNVHRTVVDIGPGITHKNHQDTITTPLPGNCGCGYPNCGGCDGVPQITLMPTVTIEPIPTFGGTPAPPTPDIPDFPTIFPTFDIGNLLPTAPPTFGIPTIAPTLIPPRIPPSPVPVG